LSAPVIRRAWVQWTPDLAQSPAASNPVLSNSVRSP
jgi:hypothetical protein